MHCTEFEDRLANYGELPPAERECVDTHLQLCPECRSWFEALSEIDAALASTFEDVHAPATLAVAVRSKAVQLLPSRTPAGISPVPEILDFVGWLAVIGAASVLAYFLLPSEYTVTANALFAIVGVLLFLTLSVTVWVLRASEN